MSTFILHKDTSRGTVMANLFSFVGRLPLSKSWKVEVSQFVKARTNQQCRYLNGVAYKLLSDATGYERDDISEYLCGEFFGWVDKRLPGKRVVQVPIRTTTTDEDGQRAVLSKTDFADYVAFVQRFGSEHGIHIPDPEI